MEQRAAAREVPGVQEHETEQRAAARDEPGVREQEQSANTVSRAIARDEPGVREHETASAYQSKRHYGFCKLVRIQHQPTKRHYGFFSRIPCI